MNDKLTRREREVRQLMADGYSNLEIASELGLHYDTVRNYVVKVCRKSGVANRYALIQEANKQAQAAQN